MGSRFSAAPRDPASVRGRPFARGNSPGPSHIRGGGTRRKKDLPFIGETVLLERKPPRGESKAHDVGPLPGLSPGSHRRGSSKNNKTHPRTHPPPPAKTPKKTRKVAPKLKSQGRKWEPALGSASLRGQPFVRGNSPGPSRQLATADGPGATGTCP